MAMMWWWICMRWSLLYCGNRQEPYGCLNISCWVLFQSSCNSCYMRWTTMKTAPWTLTPRRRWWRSCPLMMEIKSVFWRWRSKAQRLKGHIISHYELHVMLILLCILYCLDYDGSIIRLSLSLNIKIMLVACHFRNYSFYRLTTRGRVGTKLGDASYVSNVSIISYVPC